MKRGSLIVVVAVLFLGFASAAFAQQANTPPPNILQIFREEVKPGHGPAHARTEAGWPRAFAKANWPTHYVAVTSMTGPAEAWFIVGFESLAAWEQDLQNTEKNAALQAELDRLTGQDGEHLGGSRGVVARYRADLSHRPGVSIPKMRYFSITTVRVRPGHTSEYEEVRKMVKAAHEKEGLKDNHSVFQVIAGMPSGTFLVITPMKSLAEMDAAPQLHGAEYQAAMGGEAAQKKLRELASASIIVSETQIFSFSPSMSYPSKEYIAADPGYWKPKPTAKPAPPKEKPAGN
jgi:hypothetical protein